MIGFGGAMGGILFGELAGYLLDHGFGYETVFKLAATFHVIAFLVILIDRAQCRPAEYGANTSSRNQLMKEPHED